MNKINESIDGEVEMCGQEWETRWTLQKRTGGDRKEKTDGVVGRAVVAVERHKGEAPDGAGARRGRVRSPQAGRRVRTCRPRA